MRITIILSDIIRAGNAALLFILIVFLFLPFSLMAQSCKYGVPMEVLSSAQNFIEPFEPIPGIDNFKKNYPVVKVGVVNVGNIPFVFQTSDHIVRGVVPDYLNVISDILPVKFSIIGYCDYALMTKALDNHDVDVIMGTPLYPQEHQTASRPFFTNLSVEVRSKKWNENQRRHPERLAISRTEPLYSALLNNYKDDHITVYSSQLQGLLAVSSGKADLYVGNATATNFVIDRMQLLNLEIRNFTTFPQAPYSFIALKNKQEIIDVLNAALLNISTRAAADIQIRWSGFKPHYNISDTVRLSQQEVNWIEKNPVIYYAAQQDWIPIMFKMTGSGELGGLAVSYLNLISKRTGIIFKPVLVDSVASSYESFLSGKVDLLVTTTARRDKINMNYSAPMARMLWSVLVRNDNNTINILSDLSGRKVGYLAVNNPESIILDRDVSKQIKFVPSPDMLTLQEWLQQGKIDAVVADLLTANYLAALPLHPSLKVATIASETAIPLVFGVQDTSPILLGIMNKVMGSLTQEESENLLSDWSVYQDNSLYSLGGGPSGWVITLLETGSVLLLMGGLWLGYMLLKKWRQATGLRRRLKLRENLINGLPFAVFIRTVDGKLETYNQHFADSHEQNWQFSSEQGWPTDTPLDFKIGQLCDDVQLTGEALLRDMKISVQGVERDLYLWIIPLGDTDANLLGGWLDISHRKDVERQLVSARIDADTANRAKSTFLATVSHELRTPMNAILGLLELEIKSNKPVSRQALSTVSASAQMLLRLLNDIIDTARIESDQMDIHPEPCNLKEELQRLSCIYQPVATEKGLNLAFWVDDDMPECVLADMPRIRQVVSNLLSNAIKFTHKGSVSMDVLWSADSPDSGELQIDISDTGIGMSASAQQGLFRPFSQVHDAEQVQPGGSGLGLWICRHLVEKMSGSLELESQEGAGTSVFLRFPVRIASLHEDEPQVLPEPVAVKNDQLSLKVLIVDDLEANRMLLQQQLAYLGLTQFLQAKNGSEALAVMQQHRPDLVITDCNMPVMDGFQFTKIIRNTPDFAQIIVIGCTADARPETYHHCLAVGMNDCLVKPIGIQGLQQMLINFYSVSAQNLPEQGGVLEVLPPLPPLFGAIRRFTGDGEKVMQLIFLLESTTKEDERLLNIMLESQNSDGVNQIVHKIKGMAQLIQEEKLIELCEEINTRINQHGQIPKTADLQRWNNEFQRVKERIEKAVVAFQFGE
jgi:two-component system sensor histidine kinase EvgS